MSGLKTRALNGLRLICDFKVLSKFVNKELTKTRQN